MTLLDLSLRDLAARIERGELGARTLMEAALDRHAEFGTMLEAYKTIEPDRARLEADARDRDGGGAQRALGALHGIPISAKDLYGVEDFPTFGGTSHRLPDRFETEGFLVSALRHRGGVFVGKTHTVELAFGGVGTNPHWGTPVNPWDPDEERIPGGSSCGAGVSLAEGSALIALGTDTGGSIRIPAALTGVVGQKLSRGRWSTDGVVPLSTTLDTVGLLARSVEDLAFVFSELDPDVEPVCASDTPPTITGVRIGIPNAALWEASEPKIASVVLSALRELEAAGAILVEVDGALLDRASAAYFESGIVGVECAAFLDRVLPKWWDRLHPSVGARVRPARDVSGPDYVNALKGRLRLAKEALAWWADVDLLALPTVPISPPTVAEVEDPTRYAEVNRACLSATTPASYLDLCALSLPAGLDSAGMPVGMQFVGAGGKDEVLLAHALGAEQTLGTPRQRLGIAPRVRR